MILVLHLWNICGTVQISSFNSAAHPMTPADIKPAVVDISMSGVCNVVKQHTNLDIVNAVPRSVEDVSAETHVT